MSFGHVGGAPEQGRRLGFRCETPQHLQRFALDGRVAVGRRDGGRREPARLVEPVAGQRDVGAHGVQRCAQVRPGAVHRAGTFQVGGRGRRVAGGERGADEQEQELDPAARLVEPG